MSNLFLILVIAFILIVFIIACLAIGWLIKGKTKVVTASSTETIKSSESNEPSLSAQSPINADESSENQKKSS